MWAKHKTQPPHRWLAALFRHQSYQKDVGGFPASVLGKLFGIQEVELFA